MATYNELATNYANQKKQEYEQSLGYLTEGLNKQQALDKTALQQRYDNLINQINQQITPVTEQYNKNAQTAYINKMLSNQALNTQLSQLGVDTQGFGVAQRLANETAYGQNLAELQASRDNSLRDIRNQATNAMGELTAEQTALDSKYAGLLNDINKYIQEKTLAYGENEYAKYLESLKYQDQLKQLAWEQAFKEKQLAEQIRQFNAQLAFKQAQAASANSYGGYRGYGNYSGGSSNPTPAAPQAHSKPATSITFNNGKKAYAKWGTALNNSKRFNKSKEPKAKMTLNKALKKGYIKEVNYNGQKYYYTVK